MDLLVFLVSCEYTASQSVERVVISQCEKPEDLSRYVIDLQSAFGQGK